jgi:uncharacterized protein YbbK (DUF523 family)
MRTVLVSACLLGVRCRYDGQSKPRGKLQRKLRGTACIPVCPEQLGGLPTPRPPQQLVGGDGSDVLDGTARVVNECGEDVTERFLVGAQEALRLARQHGAAVAYLKSRSPSCGCGLVRIDDEWGPGDGVATALLRRNRIRVHPVP